MEPQILYSDPVLVVLDKPVGMPSQPDPSGVLSVLDWVARSLPGDPVHPVQRLDRPAGGLMAVARGRAAARDLFGQFRTRQVDIATWPWWRAFGTCHGERGAWNIIWCGTVGAICRWPTTSRWKGADPESWIIGS